MTTATQSTALATIQPAFTDPEGLLQSARLAHRATTSGSCTRRRTRVWCWSARSRVLQHAPERAERTLMTS